MGFAASSHNRLQTDFSNKQTDILAWRLLDNQLQVLAIRHTSRLGNFRRYCLPCWNGES